MRPILRPLSALNAVVLLSVLLQACGSDDREDNPAFDSVETAPATDTPAAATGDSTGASHKYHVESAVVEYWNTRLLRMQSLYFDRYGAREAVHNAPRAEGDSSLLTPFDVSIYADGWRYDYSNVSRGGKKARRSEPGPLMGVLDDRWSSPNDLLDRLNVRRLAARTILGHAADGFAYTDKSEHRLWVWNGIPLHVEIRNPNEAPIILEARSIRTGVAIPDSVFSIPADVELVEVR